MNRRERHKEERRQRIASAALAVLTEQGIDSLTVSAIAERADVSVATLYNLIGRVGAILDLLVSELLEELTAAMAESTNSGPKIFFQRFAGMNCELLSRNEIGYQRTLQTWFRLGMEGMTSAERLTQDRRSFALVRQALDRWCQQRLIVTDCHTQLLAEEILLGHMKLLETWSVGRFSMEEFNLRVQYHSYSLLKAWALPALAKELGASLDSLQNDIRGLHRQRSKVKA